AKVHDMWVSVVVDLFANLTEIREHPRPGIINALAQLRIDGEPAPDMEIIGMLTLLIGGGFDTTTALTAHALEWLSEHPDQRARLHGELDVLLNPATEEFLRYFT
ncbi:cytochrome P450, partial [Mycobacterium avium]